MTRQLCSILFLALFAWTTVGAQTIQTYENGPVHEAFVTPISANLLLDAVDFQPPEPINERIPRQLDIQSEWIAGYWKWDLNANDFIWVSGVWRRPPPGHQWISGFWKQYEGEWMRVPGYWSRYSEQHTDYIHVPPPDPLDENMAPPSSSNYFWVPGHWYYMFDEHEYHWVPGNWEELDPHWVLVPAHYVWRPGGYVYVPSYWDWPVEERGTAYAPVLIDPDYRYHVVFEPILVMDPDMIVRHLFLFYPDYLCFLHHHYHFHVDFWHNFCCMPPWWSWDTWWGFTWHDHWGLWWWYTHPGYPQPLWLTKEISGILPSPLSDLLSMFSYIHPPIIVTPNGVVSRIDFLHALNKVTESDKPIVPDEKKVLERVQQLARPVSIDPTNILKPLGRRLPIDPNAVRPNVRKPVVNPQSLSGVKIIRDDLKPRVPFKPRIPSHRGSPRWKQHEPSIQQPPPPPVRRPTWTPKSSKTYPPVQTYPERKPPQPERGRRHWRPRHQWGGEPPIHRPPVHRPRDHRRPRSSGTVKVPYPDFDRDDDRDTRRPQDQYPRSGGKRPQTGTPQSEINPGNRGSQRSPREGGHFNPDQTIHVFPDGKGHFPGKSLQNYEPQERRNFPGSEIQPNDLERKGSSEVFYRGDNFEEESKHDNNEYYLLGERDDDD